MTEQRWTMVDDGQEDYLDGIQSRWRVCRPDGSTVGYFFQEAEAVKAAAAPAMFKALEAFLMPSLNDKQLRRCVDNGEFKRIKAGRRAIARATQTKD